MKKLDIWKKANESSNVDLIVNLYCRWQDEKEYEDINDYLSAIARAIPEAYKIHKRPFGFTARAEDGDIKIFLKRKGSYVQICGQGL